MKLFALKWEHISMLPEYKWYCRKFIDNLKEFCSTNFLNESSTKCLIENLRYCPTNCMHIPLFDRFFAHDSLPFSLPDVDHAAAVFQIYKRCTFDQSNALVLIAKCKIFF